MVRDANSMSNLYPPNSPTSSSEDSDSDTQHEQPAGARERAADKYSYHDHGLPTSQGSESETFTTSPVTTSPGQRTSRALDVNNMLNPTPNRLGNDKASRRRDADTAGLETPNRVSANPHHAPITRSLPPSPVDRQEVPKDNDHASYGTFPRNIKHPVAPSSKRRGSLLPMIESHQAPFASAEAAPRRSANLPSPATSSVVHQGSAFPFPPIATHQHGSNNILPPSSRGTSPTTSPYTRNHHQQSVPPLITPPLQGYTQPSPVYAMNPPFEGYSLAPSMMHTSSQQSYPVMQISTSEGQYTIPVDTTAASKGADEKRKRNAGASARFRQRRKEREKDMGSRIAELESRLKLMEEERDHYRNLSMRYAGTPLPNSVAITNAAPPLSRHNSQGLQLSPTTMARANPAHLVNEPPYTSPGYAHIREEPIQRYSGTLSRTQSTEGHRNGRAYSTSYASAGNMPAAMHQTTTIEDLERSGEVYYQKSRNGSLSHHLTHNIHEHHHGRDKIKTEWHSRH